MTHDLTAGIHLILTPSKGLLLSTSLSGRIVESIEYSVLQGGGIVHASNVQPDHLHILLSLTGIDGLHKLIDSLVLHVQHVVAASDPSMAEFTWDNGVHVTLLPPWHIEIMASFVRDQALYHQTHTLEQELDDVFRPNSVTLDDEIDEESTLCVN